MKAKQYLKELKRLDTCIKQKMQEKQYLVLRSVSTVAPPLNHERVQTSSVGDKISGVVTSIIDLEKEIDAELDNFVNQKHKVINQIQGLSNETYVSLLYKRYVEYKRLETIAAEMNYTYQYVREVHGFALQEFDKLYAAEITAYKSPYIIQHKTYTNQQ